MWISNPWGEDRVSFIKQYRYWNDKTVYWEKIKFNPQLVQYIVKNFKCIKGINVIYETIKVIQQKKKMGELLFSFGVGKHF